MFSRRHSSIKKEKGILITSLSTVNYEHFFVDLPRNFNVFKTYTMIA